MLREMLIAKEGWNTKTNGCLMERSLIENTWRSAISLLNPLKETDCCFIWINCFGVHYERIAFILDFFEEVQSRPCISQNRRNLNYKATLVVSIEDCCFCVSLQQRKWDWLRLIAQINKVLVIRISHVFLLSPQLFNNASSNNKEFGASSCFVYRSFLPEWIEVGSGSEHQVFSIPQLRVQNSWTIYAAHSVIAKGSFSLNPTIYPFIAPLTCSYEFCTLQIPLISNSKSAWTIQLTLI